MPALLRRSLYLGYYMRETDRPRFRSWLSQISRARRVQPVVLLRDVLESVYRYNVAPMDYFHFRFFDLAPTERATWAGTGLMYEYQRAMNPPRSRRVLEDKVLFLKRFDRFVRRSHVSLTALRAEPGKAHPVLEDSAGLVVLKAARGQCGREVAVHNLADGGPEKLLHAMTAGGYQLAEAYLRQHPRLMALSPAGLNTIRVVTQIVPGGGVAFLGARLRVTIDRPIDNLAAGNLAAPLDLDTGCVTGPGVYSDITRADAAVHPLTGVPLVGFRLPFWRETLKMVSEAAWMIPENRSVGWDVAVSEEGPELIEGNHNWCKLLWQLPVKEGLKALLEPYR